MENKKSKRWDGKERGIPAGTAVRTGQRGADGLQKVEEHWPGKGGKETVLWNCVTTDEEGNSTAKVDVEGTRVKRASGKAADSATPSRPRPQPGRGKPL